MSSTFPLARIAVAAPIDKTLCYLVPPELAVAARVGCRVRVPLGRREALGFVLELSAGEAAGLKPILEVLDQAPLFGADLVPFFERASSYYLHPVGECIRTALPAGLGALDRAPKILKENFYFPGSNAAEPSGARQREILEAVREQGGMSLSALRERFGAPHAALARLGELGFLASREQELCRDPFLRDLIPPDAPPEPTAEQAEAIACVEAALTAGTFSPFLLHGVTGSGKTEVYLRTIERCLEQGRDALILVPEIALTPQLVRRFRARFFGMESRMAVLHSGLSDGERYDGWRRIAKGEVRMVIGARSAVFAPLPRLGILVVDEEHDASYKQQEGFRYNARDLALLRGQMAGACVLLGSATPSLASFRRARDGGMGMLRLSERPKERPMPAVELVDMSRHPRAEILSEPVRTALAAVLTRGEQAMVLLNRRGFAPFLLCQECGQSFRCPNCEITLTYHQKIRLIRCHYCDYAERPPEQCPRCGGRHIEPAGAGTERLEEDLRALFPQARIARMDRDSLSRKGAHEALAGSMREGEIDILVGTQMIAKGHDFPGVTLVAVVNADDSLNFPDFRSAERTFALLSQVAGRAGRAERPGQVFIQTYAPEHYALSCAATHDYEGFFACDIAFRKELDYPPFGYLANLVFSGNDEKKVASEAQRLASELCRMAGEAQVLGPAPCPLARLRGKSRVQLLLKAATRPAMRRLLTLLQQQRKVASGVGLTVDVDPMDML